MRWVIFAAIGCLVLAPAGVGQITHASPSGPPPARDTSNQQSWLRDELLKTTRETPAEIRQDVASAKHDVFSDDFDPLLGLLAPVLHSQTAGERVGGLQILLALRVTAWAKETLPEQRLDEMTVSLAPEIMDHGDLNSQKLLAQALGAVTTEQSRAILWKMVQRRVAYGEALLCLTSIGEARDLPRLASILSDNDPADPDGRERIGLCEALRSGYGELAIPFLNSVAQQAQQPAIRASCAKELAMSSRK